MTSRGRSDGQRRAFSTAAAAPDAGGVALMLDGRPAKTPAGAILRVPAPALGAAIAAEWNAAGARLDFAATPLTRLAVAVIDRAFERAQWAEEILGFARTDLLCCRAEGPRALVALEEQVWSPYLDWAANALGARLLTAAGVIAIAQPDAAIAALSRRLDGLDDWRLLGARRAAVLSGSAILGLALEANAFGAEDIFAASRLEERYQAEKWGVDAEAQARERRIAADFMIAARWLSLLAD